MNIIHLLCGTLLIFFHGIFTIRGIYLLKKQIPPTQPDRIILQLSQALLPLALLSGIVLFFIKQTGNNASVNALDVLHYVFGFLPVPLIIIFQFMGSFKRRYPYLLPLVNFLVLIAAALTAIL